VGSPACPPNPRTRQRPCFNKCGDKLSVEETDDTESKGGYPDSATDTVSDTVSDSRQPDSSSDTGFTGTDSDSSTETADTGVEVTENCNDGWCEIPAGTYLRGALPTESCVPAYSANPVEVTLTRPFLMLATELTQARWESMGFPNPSWKKCPDCPVTRINWWDALAFCNAMSEAEGLDTCYDLSCCTGEVGSGCAPGQDGCGGGFVCRCEGDETFGNVLYKYADVYACPGYRLPTAAEWEYAARAGTPTGTYNGNHQSDDERDCQPDPVVNEIAWNCSNTEEVMPVAQLKKNGYGLYDMLGNIIEYLSDPYSNREYPGGTDPHGYTPVAQSRAISRSRFGSDPSCCNVSWIGGGLPATKSLTRGFRPVRTLFPDTDSDSGK
jgi:formylglycine-generating enzyme required for sulfatase activity